jgi:hypothetical protein
MSEAEPDNLCDIVASVCPRAEVQQLLRQHFRHLHSSIRDGVFPAFRVPKRTVDNTLLTVNANTGLEYLAVADRGDCVVKSFNRLNQIDGITHMLIIMHVAEMLLREGKAMTQVLATCTAASWWRNPFNSFFFFSLACPLAAVCIAVGCIRRWEQREIYYMYKVGFLAFEPAPVLH